MDALSYTRELKAMGVNVFFINDGINTATNDGELRLTIMSSMAQDESRKISERVKAGQKISREKHVLYGSGNILGYRRENGTYVPDPDQAETVRLIFQMYSDGEKGLTQATGSASGFDCCELGNDPGRRFRAAMCKPEMLPLH